MNCQTASDWQLILFHEWGQSRSSSHQLTWFLNEPSKISRASQIPKTDPVKPYKSKPINDYCFKLLCVLIQCSCHSEDLEFFPWWPSLTLVLNVLIENLWLLAKSYIRSLALANSSHPPSQQLPSHSQSWPLQACWLSTPSFYVLS